VNKLLTSVPSILAVSNIFFLITSFYYCAEVGIQVAIKPEFRITPPVSI
jgi:hypothetical protein